MSNTADTTLARHALGHIVERLARRYAGRFDDATICRTVEQIERRYAEATVQTFIPLLVERDARFLLDSVPGASEHPTAMTDPAVGGPN